MVFKMIKDEVISLLEKNRKMSYRDVWKNLQGKSDKNVKKQYVRTVLYRLRDVGFLKQEGDYFCYNEDFKVDGKLKEILGILAIKKKAKRKELALPLGKAYKGLIEFDILLRLGYIKRVTRGVYEITEKGLQEVKQ